MTRERAGLALGLLGVLAFSLTLPMTRVAVAELDPWLVAFGRMAVAGLLAAGWLLWTGARAPARTYWKPLAWTAAGVVFGFPLCTSLAMQTLPAGQGAIVTGMLPLATAALAARWFHERQPRRFWACALAGALLVVGFALRDGVHALAAGYLWMLAAVGLAAVGYALGARAAATLGGGQVILWVLVGALPVTLPAALWLASTRPLQAGGVAWAGFAYVAVVSQLTGFFAWYNGLALGGIARVGQVQLLQVFFTLAFAALLFGEPQPGSTWVVAGAVVALIVVGRSRNGPGQAARAPERANART